MHPLMNSDTKQNRSKPFGCHRRSREGSGQILIPTLVLFFFMAWSFLAQTAVALEKFRIPDVLWAHEQSELKPDPQATFGRLDNGFRYVLFPNKLPEHRVSAFLSIQAGSVYEEDHQQGMAHFLEHMAFSGSTHFPPGELVKYFQSIGMQFGHDANARTGFYDTVYNLQLPGGKVEDLEKGLKVLQDYAQGALLLPEEIERERKVVLAEMLTRDSSAYRTFVAAIGFELPGMRITSRMPIGQEDVLRKMDRDSIKTFYDTWYSPRNMILILVGDFQEKEAIEALEKYFGAMTPRAAPGVIPDPGSFSHEGVKAFHHYEKEEGSTTVSLEVVRPWRQTSDSFSFQREQMIMELANRIIQYRIDERLRRADAPFSRASIHSGIYHNVASYSELSGDCRPERWEETLFQLEQILRQALEHGFTQGELDRVRREKLSELDQDVKNMTARDSMHLARALNGSITANRVFQAPDQKMALFAPVISQLTAKDLDISLKKAWAPDHRLVLVTGNALPGVEKKSAEEKILRAYKESVAVAVVAPGTTRQAVFPYLPEPDAPASISLKKHDPESDVTQIDFFNQVRLNLKPTDYKANEVLMCLSFGRGKSSEPENLPGLSDLSAGVINESGLGPLGFEDLKSALAGKKTALVFRVAEDRFSLEVSTVPEEIDLAFELLRTHVLDQAYEIPAFDLAVKREHQQYEMLNHSIEGAVELFGRRFFASGDSRFGLPSKEAFDRLTLSDVKAWISGALSRSDLEVSVVGNFDPERVIQSAARRLGTLPPPRDLIEERQRPNPVFASGQSLEVSVDTEISRAMVFMAYPTEDMWNIGRTRRLSILAEIFSEKIREQVREKLGAAYSPDVTHRPSRAYEHFGTLDATVETDPANVEKVLAEVKTIARDLSEKGVTGEDVKRALDPLLTRLKDMRRENRYWLNTVLAGSRRHPEQIAWSKTLFDDYAAITAEEISRLAKQVLDPAKAAVFVAVPDVP